MLCRRPTVEQFLGYCDCFFSRRGDGGRAKLRPIRPEPTRMVQPWTWIHGRLDLGDRRRRRQSQNSLCRWLRRAIQDDEWRRDLGWMYSSRQRRIGTNNVMLAEVIARARTRMRTAFFAPGLADIGLIGWLAEASPIPLNMMVGDATPPAQALAELGVARVSHGPRPYPAAMRVLEMAARVECSQR